MKILPTLTWAFKGGINGAKGQGEGRGWGALPSEREERKQPPWTPKQLRGATPKPFFSESSLKTTSCNTGETKVCRKKINNQSKKKKKRKTDFFSSTSSQAKTSELLATAHDTSAYFGSSSHKHLCQTLISPTCWLSVGYVRLASASWTCVRAIHACKPAACTLSHCVCLYKDLN